MLWGYLVHLGYNMWEDHGPEHRVHPEEKIDYPARTKLRCQEEAWDILIESLLGHGVNLLVIDLGEGIKYESHPELAIENSWSVEKFKSKLEVVKKLGIEPVPKLNFSTAHDVWLGKYSRMVSTDVYYQVCQDLIKEVIDIFCQPKFFHLGMDEETYGHQQHLLYAVIRHSELWWHDLYFLVEQVEKRNVTPWVWSDYLWNHQEEFLEKMPKSVIQSNWYYGTDFNPDIPYVKAYLTLEKSGYKQIPTASNHSHFENFEKTVDFCQKNISSENLLGFLQTVWRPTVKEWLDSHFQALKAVKQGRQKHHPRERKAEI
ncbi:MAG: Tat pathway signal protein [Candidatus Omnitrophica bacterium]|nr:Tat pathway signal protein [Candidatus Omnitrophota bacterium]